MAAGSQLQLFNLTTKQKVISYLSPDEVLFWSFLAPDLLALVTQSAVYHWDISAPTNTPVKQFDRHPSLAGAQIIGYRSLAAPDHAWTVLIGILPNPDPNGFKVKGACQLYCKERQVSQSIEAHAATFAHLRLDGASQDTKLFSFATRTATGAKVCNLFD